MSSKSPNRKDIANAIRYHRLQAGFTQAALARGISAQFSVPVTEGQIIDTESGHYRISATSLYRIARTLDVAIERFFRRSN